MNLKWLPHWTQDKAQLSSDDRFPSSERPENSQREAQPAAGLAMPISADIILEELRDVEDPELGISIVELGLIYGIEVQEGTVNVKMTLTSPGCPIGPMLQTAVHGAVKRVYPDVQDIKVDLVWNPPWDPYTMASEEAKDMLGIW